MSNFRWAILGTMFLVGAAPAEISIGVDLTTTFYNNNESERGSERKTVTSKNTISFGPTIGFHPLKLVEIAPFFKWNITSANTETTYNSTADIRYTTNTQQKNEYSQHGIEPGLGVYFHLINNSNVIDFSLGPRISYQWSFKPHQKSSSGTTSITTEYEKYYNGKGIAALRTNIDLTFSEHFAVRLSTNLFQFSIVNLVTKLRNDTSEYKGFAIESDFRTVFQPSGGFYFTF
jgi:hypothetical protein